MAPTAASLLANLPVFGSAFETFGFMMVVFSMIRRTSVHFLDNGIKTKAQNYRHHCRDRFAGGKVGRGRDYRGYCPIDLEGVKRCKIIA